MNSTEQPNVNRLIDRAYYTFTYEDVASVAIDPVLHYMQYGWREGRNPSATFNTLYYISRHMNGELQNPILHYINKGEQLGHQTCPNSSDEYMSLQAEVIRAHFDETYYRRANPGSNGDLVFDFLRCHASGDSRNPTQGFSIGGYLDQFSFLRRDTANPFFHYVVLNNPANKLIKDKPIFDDVLHDTSSFTDTELEEIIRMHFDSDLYLRSNQDVTNFGLDPVRHYVNHGWKEGRDPSRLFWTRFYLTENPDVEVSEQNPFFHYIRHGRWEGRRPNPIGTQLWSAKDAIPFRDWSQAAPALKRQADVVVIMPVYRGYEETLDAIYSVLTEPQRVCFRLLVINDASPDAELSAKLRELAESKLFDYVEKSKNSGFVDTVNLGLSLVQKEDVILLNSDVIVFHDWIDRFRAHALTNNYVGTITPFSNNATTFSYPDKNQDNTIALECSLRDLDAIFSEVNRSSNSEALTGVGFCMYITNFALRSVGFFDVETFGRGYGEENDFCMRAKQKNLENLHAHDIFVFHQGSVSFGSYDNARMSAAQSALCGKHPDYPTLVRRYISADFAKNARRRVDAFRLAKGIPEKCAIFYFNRPEGGIKTHVVDMIKLLQGQGVVTLSIISSPTRPWEVTFVANGFHLPYTPNFSNLDLKEPLAKEFFSWLNPEIFHIHSLGRILTRDLERFGELLKILNCPKFFTIHDFGAICNRFNFVREDGFFCGALPASPCKGCWWQDTRVDDLDTQELRHLAFTEIFRQCKLISPSQTAADRMKEFFPKVDCLIRPHPDFVDPMFIAEKNQDIVMRIAIVGAIGAHKGSDLIFAVASDAKMRGLPISFHIVGYSDIDAFMLDAGVEITGSYNNDNEAIEHLIKIRPDAIWLPSICPETYSYSLNLPLALGLPPIVFDIGAMAERLRDITWAFILPIELIKRPGELNDVLLALPLDSAWAARKPIKPNAYSNLLNEYYSIQS